MSSPGSQHIQEILSFQGKLGRPSPQICATIAGLKDLCELNGTQVEWRRGTSGASSPGMFRNSSTGSLASGGQSPSPFPRNASTKSFGSTGSETPASPTAKHGGTYTPGRYQSKFKNTSQPVEDKILNNIILSKLNKFSPSTYVDIREFLYQILGSGEPDLAEMIRHFMLLVFKKAASEEIYCSLYAKLLSEISSRYGVILEEMHKLHANYIAIFDDVEEKEENEKYSTFVEKNIEKRYRQGYSQFIAELAGLEIMQLTHLEQTFKRIFDTITKNASVPDMRSMLEEYADCLLRMSRVFKKKSSPFLVAARQTLFKLSAPTIDEIISAKPALQSISPKIRFILMDVKDNLSA